MRLHIKGSAGRAALEEINTAILRDPVSAEDVRLWKYYYEKFTNIIRSTIGAEIEEVNPLELSGVALQEMIEKRVIAELTPDELQQCRLSGTGGGLKVFTIAEWLKDRRRIIRFTQRINDENSIEDEFKVPLPSEQQLFSRLQHAACACIDIEGFYDSLRLPEAATMAYVFSAHGRFFKLLTVPTGQRHSVGLAQLIARWLVHGVRAPTDVWIDNIRIVDSPTFEADVDSIFSRAAALNLVINESRESVKPLSSYDFLGVRYNHSSGTIAIAAKTLQKIFQVRSTLSTSKSFAALDQQQALEIFGLFLWSDHIVRAEINRSDFYYIFKNLRRIAQSIQQRGAPSKQPGALWASTFTTWKQWANLLARNRPQKVLGAATVSSQRVTIYTDASLSGWGVVIFVGHSKSPSVIAGDWPSWVKNKNPTINELEIAAIVNMAIVTELKPGTMIDLYCDNTTAIAGVKKGILRNFHESNALMELAHVFNEKKWGINSIQYVNTKDNPADYFSRIIQASTSYRQPKNGSKMGY